MLFEQPNHIKKLQPLIKIIKDHESLYFEALSFAIRNIQSSFDDFDQIYIFRKFLNESGKSQAQLLKIQEQFLQQLGPVDQFQSEGLKISNISKQMMRLRSRALEIMEEAVERARKSLFGDNGRLTIDFTRFKKTLHKILKQNPIDLFDFASHFITFSKLKYRKQIVKLKTYLSKLQSGEQVSLRDMFANKEGSDISSPDQKIKLKSISKVSKKSSNKEQTSETQSPHRRPSTRKVSQSGTKTKKNLGLKAIKKDDGTQKQKKNSKDLTAAQLLKFYSMMELNKRQFLEDYVFQKSAQEQQRKRLMAVLMQKNKFNDEQIKQYQLKCANYNPSIHSLQNPSSDQNASLIHRNDSSVGSRMSLRTSFIISKRKPSFTFQSPSQRSDGQLLKSQLPFSRTIKNFSSRKPSNPTAVTSRPKNESRSKKIFVVKSPMIFQDEVIPKAEMNNTSQWIQHPLTGSKEQRNTQKRSEHIRLKKRNNPCPLDNNFLPESFQFTQYPV